MEKPFAAYSGSEPYIFVSYAHADAEQVYPELVALKEAGFNVWYDEGISPGAIWRDELAEHLASCALFLFFISPQSVASSNCSKEVNFALSKDRPFLNVFLQPTELTPGLEFSLSDVQAVEKHSLDAGAYRQKLNKSIQNLLPTREAEVDGYSIVELLQHSAHYSRFRAVDLLLGSDVELFVISENAESRVRAELLEEAGWFAKAGHAGFQRPLKVGSWKEATYVALEFVGRESLDSLMSRSKKIPFEFKLGFAHQIASILGYIERAGHPIAEFHPELFLVRPAGELCLRFGSLSHPVIADPSEMRYASPEEISGSRPDIQANYFGFGILLYELLLRRLPYPANLSVEERYEHIQASVNEFTLAPPYVHGGDLQHLLRNRPAGKLLNGLLTGLTEIEPERRKLAFQPWDRLRPDGTVDHYGKLANWLRTRIEAILAQLLAHWEISGSPDSYGRFRFLQSLSSPELDPVLEQKVLAGDELDDTELDVYWTVWAEEVGKRQREYRRYLEGDLDGDRFRLLERSFAAWINRRASRTMWDKEKEIMDDDFINYVESNLLDNNSAE